MTALATALAYHKAWTDHDLEHAMTYIADDVVCHAPAGLVQGAQAFHAFMGPFVESLEAAALLACYGDDTTALLMYDTETVLVPSAPGAELLTVRDGKIIEMRIVFDRLPFAEARSRP
ncbi:nuclear transport factor 2 family protein [Allokutzneria albata]|uniref:SnoaL-like domain-containing protein n=1 Tax=Allokutzneria albata TaxID=211114 RepID=A0A1G9V4H0_ALLAB|nr:nuclear transport factor 2 family protein [Allokutzneria albata]SDM66725.1 SnoaL-like domain-containing protein [Allokutzneria albata]